MTVVVGTIAMIKAGSGCYDQEGQQQLYNLSGTLIDPGQDWVLYDVSKIPNVAIPLSNLYTHR